MTSPPPAPGAASPASAHARSRAAARAARTAFSARGRSAASWLTSRDTTGSDATGPASPGCSRSTAMSARQSPPSATAAARSATILPGSWTARGARHRENPATGRGPGRSPALSPTAGPPRPGTPAPGRRRTRPHGQFVRYSSPEKCLRLEADRTLDKPYLSRSKALFHLHRQPPLIPGESPRLGPEDASEQGPPGVPLTSAAADARAAEGIERAGDDRSAAPHRTARCPAADDRSPAGDASSGRTARMAIQRVAPWSSARPRTGT